MLVNLNRIWIISTGILCSQKFRWFDFVFSRFLHFHVSCVYLVSLHLSVWLDRICCCLHQISTSRVSTLTRFHAISPSSRGGDCRNEMERRRGGKCCESRTRGSAVEMRSSKLGGNVSDINHISLWQDDTGWREWRMTTIIITAQWAVKRNNLDDENNRRDYDNVIGV